MMKLIMKLTATGEVAVFIDDNQFGGGQSTMKCGYEAVALFWHCTQPGKANPYTANDVHAMAHDDYTKFVGPDVASDYNGMTNEELYADLTSHNFHYRQIPMDVAWIQGYLRYGYPVILGVVEDSVLDLELGAKPYSWDTTGYTHVIIATGCGSHPHALKVRDTANIGPSGVRPGPREYDTNRLQYVSATVVVPSWLPVPDAAFDPRQTPVPQPLQPTLLQASADDLHLWNLLVKDIPLVASHGIPQSWLVGRWMHAQNFGCPLEAEYEIVRNGVSCMEQQFTGARASWNSKTNITTWFDARGVCFSL